MSEPVARAGWRAGRAPRDNAEVRRVIVFLPLVGLALTLGAPTLAGPRPSTYELDGEHVYPEGVAFEQDTGFFYVSGTTDGTIFRGSVHERVAEPFLPGLPDGRATAVGLAVADGRLYVAGGETGGIWVYDTQSSALVRAFITGPGGFVNDVTVADGDAYLTDSFRPILWRVPAEEQEPGAPPTAPEPWLNLVGSPITYGPGFNLNGIVATPDGESLITVQSSTGELFRIDIDTEEIHPIDVDTQSGELTNADGLALQGHTLYAVRNSEAVVSKVRLSEDYTSAVVVSETTDPSFRFPTTNAVARGRMLVVNSQFDRRMSPGVIEDETFTVSSIPIP